MSTRDVITAMLGFGMFILALESFILMIIKHMFDMYDKKK